RAVRSTAVFSLSTVKDDTNKNAGLQACVQTQSQKSTASQSVRLIFSSVAPSLAARSPAALQAADGCQEHGTLCRSLPSPSPSPPDQLLKAVSSSRAPLTKPTASAQQSHSCEYPHACRCDTQTWSEAQA